MAPGIKDPEASVGREPEARGSVIGLYVTGKRVIKAHTIAHRKASILVDPITAFVLTMLGWAALIGHTFFMYSRERRSGLIQKQRPDEESKRSERD